ncbi:putative flippase GtrA [Stenotrophomonas rhizophila]|uniref:Putative flippase GtrA n=1 Tax=Stenotrophomonas rhizophila TaxID=216778 RepID=A0A498CTR2_9GAMM|nr:GtrA family protein [Stenotrophomonas rhizophila]MBU2048833.1 GtrA family protein [Gammaproteobacteria bacterium]RLK57375.1 putative flippase GtrA [Stenotrophomonas rhizophila]
MSLLRQGSRYLVVGLIQLVLDWAVFVAATALGMPAAPGNLLGRVSGMLLGFWLNGRYTFAHDGEHRLGWPRFVRFALLWAVLTGISTLLVTLTAEHMGLRYAWLAKPLVEGALAGLSFLLMRTLIFR